MTAINSEYLCDFVGCAKYLKEPITLPCGDIVCREHVDGRATSFECPICDNEFIIPEEGFKINIKMSSLINKNSHLTGQHKQAKEIFDQLEKEIEDFQKSNLAHPQLYIHDYFSSIRNKIDLHREQMIESIHKRSEKLLNKLKLIEEECNRNEEKIEKIDFEANKVKLNELSEKLRLSNLKVEELIQLQDSINLRIEKFITSCKKLEKKILMQKTISFEPFDSKEFGQIKIKKHLDLEMNTDSGRLITKFKGHTGWVKCIGQIENFSKIITGSGDKTIKIWSTESGECLKTLTGHTDFVKCLIISNDKKYLISGSTDKTIKVWDIENDFECVHTFQQESFVLNLCLLPNNILACGLWNGKINKWNLNSFIKIDSFKAHQSYIWDLKHVSSSQIVSCSEDQTIKLWNLETNERLRTFSGHKERVVCLEISFDKSKLYSGSVDDTLRVWDISSGQRLNSINFSPVLCLKILSINFLAVGLYGKKDNLKIIDLNSLEIVKSLETQSESANCLNFNRNKNELFVGSNDGPVKMFQF
jgi:WD40 repeat protein